MQILSPSAIVAAEKPRGEGSNSSFDFTFSKASSISTLGYIDLISHRNHTENLLTQGERGLFFIYKY